MTYRGQGVCDLPRSASGDPRNVSSWHITDYSLRCSNSAAIGDNRTFETNRRLQSVGSRIACEDDQGVYARLRGLCRKRPYVARLACGVGSSLSAYGELREHKPKIRSDRDRRGIVSVEPIEAFPQPHLVPFTRHGHCDRILVG